MRRRALVLVITSVGALTLALALSAAAIAGNGGTLPLPAHSPNAHKIRETYVFILVFAGIVFVAVEGALIALMVRYRRGKRGRYQDGIQIHGSTRLEIIWTVVPVLILAAIGVFVFIQLPGISNIPSASASDSTKITVEGHQFYWMFKYPNGAVSVGTMIAPAENVVTENVTAPDNEVLHSWWVPELGGKIDAIPGRTNETWFKAAPGDYAARCSDLCGIEHAKMKAQVKVVSRADYEAFINARAAAPTSVVLGKEEFQHVCAVCHRLNTTYIGPPLGTNPVLTNASQLAPLIRDGVGEMPAVASDWSKEQIEALVAYTKTLPKPAGSTSGG